MSVVTPLIAMQPTLVAEPAAAVVAGIAVEYFSVEAVRRHPDAVVMPWHGSEVASHDQLIGLPLRLS